MVGEEAASSTSRTEWRPRDADLVEAVRHWPVDEVWVLDDEPEPLRDQPQAEAGGAGGPGLAGQVRTIGAAGARAPAPSAPVAGARRRGVDEELPSEVVEELIGAVGREPGERLARQLASAARSYRRDRYEEALRITRTLVVQAPESMAAVELHGLVCYRLGKWQQAAKFLTQVVEMDGGVEGAQIPVLMDCHRALNHHRRVRELWDELRSLSPDSDVLVEGRLVLAADLADRDLLNEAIALLVEAGAGRSLRRPADRHLRQWYLLADLYERAGDLSRARDLFQLVVEHDPEVADARTRLAALGGGASDLSSTGARRGSVTLGELARAPKVRIR